MTQCSQVEAVSRFDDSDGRGVRVEMCRSGGRQGSGSRPGKAPVFIGDRFRDV